MYNATFRERPPKMNALMQPINKDVVMGLKMTKFEEELSSLPTSKVTKYTEYWNKAQLLTVFKDWQPLYIVKQIQERTEIKRDYILIIDGGIGTKLRAIDRFTGTEAVDVYGDKYKVVNHVKNGKKWVLDNKEDTKND